MHLADLLFYNKSRLLVAGLLCLVGIAVCLSFTPFLFPELFHSLTQHQQSTILSKSFIPVAMLLVAGGCLHFLFQFTGFRFQILGAHRMRQDILTIHAQLPFQQFRHREDDLRFLQEPVELLWSHVVALCWNLPYTIVLLVLLAALMLSSEGELPLSVFAILIGYAAIHQRQKHRSIELAHRQYYTRHLLQRKIEEFVSAAQAIKFLNLEERELARMDSVTDESSWVAWAQWRTRLTLSMIYFAALIGSLTIIWINVFPATEGGHTGPALSMMVYTALAVSLIAQSKSYFTHWSDLNTLSRQLQPWMDWSPDEAQRRMVSPAGPISVSIKQADFSYAGSPQPAVRGISLSIGPRECVGIRGEKGAGKTTLLYLIAGLFVPTRGNVRACGIDTWRFNASHWLRRTGILPKRVYLFSSTLAENIAGTEADADAERIVIAAGMAGLHPLINRLEKGLASVISDNDPRIDEGDRLRIGIARLFIRPYSMLLLDEPGARLGLSAQSKIIPVLGKLIKNKTVCLCSNIPEILVLAQRVATLHYGENLPQQLTQQPNLPQHRMPAKRPDPPIPAQQQSMPAQRRPVQQQRPAQPQIPTRPAQRRLPAQPMSQRLSDQRTSRSAGTTNLPTRAGSPKELHLSATPPRPAIGDSPVSDGQIGEFPELTPVKSITKHDDLDTLLQVNQSSVCESAQQLFQTGKSLLNNDDRNTVTQGVDLLHQAAKLGFAPAQSQLGTLHETGFAMVKNLPLAAQYYQAAARNGYTPAQSNLAVLLEKGLGVAQNKKLAKRWYLQAAQHGDTKAQNNLGVLILNMSTAGGQGHQEAAKWFNQAAQKGHIGAMYNLGMLYEQSPIFHHDIRNACYWYMRAAALGHTHARDRLEYLSQSNVPN